MRTSIFIIVSLVIGFVLGVASRPNRALPDDLNKKVLFSTRSMEVVRLAFRGETNPKVVATIEKHIGRLSKLNNNQTRYAVEIYNGHPKAYVANRTSKPEVFETNMIVKILQALGSATRSYAWRESPILEGGWVLEIRP